MQYFFYFIAIVVMVGLQQGLFSLFSVFGAVPNLVLLFVLSLAVKQDKLDFYFVALIGGLVLDFVSGLGLGSYTTFFLVAGFITHQLFADVIFYEFNIKHLPLLVALTISALPFWLWGYSSLLILLHANVLPVSLKELLLRLPASVVYNLLLMYPTYWLATKLFSYSTRLGERRKRMA